MLALVRFACRLQHERQVVHLYVLRLQPISAASDDDMAVVKMSGKRTPLRVTASAARMSPAIAASASISPSPLLPGIANKKQVCTRSSAVQENGRVAAVFRTLRCSLVKGGCEKPPVKVLCEGPKAITFTREVRATSILSHDRCGPSAPIVHAPSCVRTKLTFARTFTTRSSSKMPFMNIPSFVV